MQAAEQELAEGVAVQEADQGIAEEGPVQAAQQEAVQATERGAFQEAAGVVAAAAAATAEAIQQLPEPCSPPAGGVPNQQPEVKRQQEEEAVPSWLTEECAATPLPAAVQQHGSQEVGAEQGGAGGHEEPLPLSSAKPISRAQLRQQLQRQSQRSARAEASPGVRLAGGLAAGTPPSAGSGRAAHVLRSTRGQRLLSLARQQQHRPPPAADTAQPAAEVAQLQPQPQPGSVAAEDGDQMQLDQPEAPAVPAAAGAAPLVEQPGVASGRPVQRRLTQSPFSRRPAAAGASSAELQGGELPSAPADAAPAEAEQAHLQASPAAAAVAAAGSPPPAATPLSQHASLPMSAAAVPSTAPQGAQPVPDELQGGHSSPAAPARGQSCSSAQSPVAHEGAVVAALHQVCAPARQAHALHFGGACCAPIVRGGLQLCKLHLFTALHAMPLVAHHTAASIGACSFQGGWAPAA